MKRSLLHLHKPRGGDDENDFPIGIFLLLTVVFSVVLQKVIVLAGDVAGLGSLIAELRSAVILLSILIGLLVSTFVCEHLQR